MYYEKVGTGEPALVLIHGSFLSTFSWRYVIHPLAEYGTVVAFDRCAFGRTSRPVVVSRQHSSIDTNNPYSPEGQADMTIALLDTLGIEKAVLVGNSTGGTIALLTALRHPERVQGLVLVDAMVYSGYPVSEMPAAVRQWFPRKVGAMLVGLIIRRMYNTIIRTFWYNRSRVTEAMLATYRHMIHAENWNGALWALISETHRLGLAEQLRHIRVPSLVITGEYDKPVPIEQSMRLAHALPGAGLAVIPQCGHVPHEECPEAFLCAVQRFMASLL